MVGACALRHRPWGCAGTGEHTSISGCKDFPCSLCMPQHVSTLAWSQQQEQVLGHSICCSLVALGSLRQRAAPVQLILMVTFFGLHGYVVFCAGREGAKVFPERRVNPLRVLQHGRVCVSAGRAGFADQAQGTSAAVAGCTGSHSSANTRCAGSTGWAESSILPTETCFLWALWDQV